MGEGRGKDGREGLTEELGLHQVLKDEPGFQIDEEKERGVLSGERQMVRSRCQPRGHRRLVTGAGVGVGVARKRMLFGGWVKNNSQRCLQVSTCKCWTQGWLFIRHLGLFQP